MIILAIQSTYTGIELGLYKESVTTLIGYTCIPKDKSSSILSNINTLLENNSLLINDISLCIVNRGPAPFTTLRTVIATVNGLKASLNIPLIGVDGLDALNSEYTNQKEKSIILLNAFAGDFYFYIDNTCKGICSKERLNLLLQKYNISAIIGNGGPLITDSLPQKNSCKIIDFQKGCCSIDTLVSYGYQNDIKALDKNLLTTYVSPLYFKEATIF